jgi:hypothetical protein
MTSTTSLVVIEGPAAHEAIALMAAARRALDQAGRALPGTTRDVRRYEDTLAAVEHLARVAQHEGARVLELPVDEGLHGTVATDTTGLEEWAGLGHEERHELQVALSQGAVVVELRSPYGRDPGRLPPSPTRPPAERWDAPERGAEAAAARFRHLVENAASGEAGAAIIPCGVHNRAVTETLREFVVEVPTPSSAPVPHRSPSAACMAPRALRPPSASPLRSCRSGIRSSTAWSMVPGCATST